MQDYQKRELIDRLKELPEIKAILTEHQQLQQQFASYNKAYQYATTDAHRDFLKAQAREVDAKMFVLEQKLSNCLHEYSIQEGRLVRRQFTDLKTADLPFDTPLSAEETAKMLHREGVRSARMAMGRYFLTKPERVGYGEARQRRTGFHREQDAFRGIFGMRDWLLGASTQYIKEVYKIQPYSFDHRVVGLAELILERCRDSGLVEDFYPGAEEDRMVAGVVSTDKMGYEGKLPMTDVVPRHRNGYLQDLNFWLFQLEKQAKLWNVAIDTAPAPFSAGNATQQELKEKNRLALEATSMWRDFDLTADYIRGDETLNALGVKYGITRERVRQILLQMLRRLIRQSAVEAHAQARPEENLSLITVLRTDRQFWLGQAQALKERLSNA